MDSSKLDLLQNHIDSKEFRHGVQQGFWTLLERCEHILLVQFSAMDDEEYLMKLDCDRYGQQAIGGKFVDPISKDCITTAWPAGNGVFEGWVKWKPGNFFLCWPGDRFGIQHHSDWVARLQWQGEPNQLVKYLNFIRRLLWKKTWGYSGRAK